MMKNIRIYILSLFILALAGLTACEGFKGNKVSPSEAVEGNKRNAPESETDASIDQQIVDFYSKEFNSYDQADNEALRDKIIGMDLTLVLDDSGPVENLTGDQSFEASFNMFVGNDYQKNGQTCYRGSNFELSKMIKLVDLQDMKPHSIGRPRGSGTMEAILQCTLDDCSEMVATLREHGRAMAHFGLKLITSSNEAGQYVHRYQSRKPKEEIEGMYVTANVFSAYYAAMLCENMPEEDIPPNDAGDTNWGDSSGGSDNDSQNPGNGWNDGSDSDNAWNGDSSFNGSNSHDDFTDNYPNYGPPGSSNNGSYFEDLGGSQSSPYSPADSWQNHDWSNPEFSP